jgi:hypothetical protein
VNRRDVVTSSLDARVAFWTIRVTRARRSPRQPRVTQFPAPYPPQQPQPHQTAPYTYGGQPGYAFHTLGTDVLKPARRAALLMIVLGALVTLFGLCNAVTAMVMSPEMVAEQESAMKAAGLPESNISAEAFRTMTVVMGALTLLVGVTFIVVGAFVRRGSRAATVTGLIVASALALLLGLFALLCLIAAFAAPVVAAYACLFAIPFFLLIWLIAWLAQAVRASGAVAAAHNQFNAQFYQYQQQQQAYAYPVPPGYGYGYGYPAPQTQPQQPAAPIPPPADENLPPTS